MTMASLEVRELAILVAAPSTNCAALPAHANIGISGVDTGKRSAVDNVPRLFEIVRREATDGVTTSVPSELPWTSYPAQRIALVSASSAAAGS